MPVQFFSGAHPADRLIRRQLLHHLLLAARVVARDVGIDERRVNARRADTVAPDVVLHVIDGDRPRHRQHGALGHRVRETVGQTHQRRDGLHVQYHAATLLEHSRDGGPGAQEHALDVDAVQLI